MRTLAALLVILLATPAALAQTVHFSGGVGVENHADTGATWLRAGAGAELDLDGWVAGGHLAASSEPFEINAPLEGDRTVSLLVGRRFGAGRASLTVRGGPTFISADRAKLVSGSGTLFNGEYEEESIADQGVALHTTVRVKGVGPFSVVGDYVAGRSEVTGTTHAVTAGIGLRFGG